MSTAPTAAPGRSSMRWLSYLNACEREVAKNQPDYLVFISHSSKDRWIARQMAAIIERKAKRYGVRTFLDEVDLEGGDRIPATIKANLHACEEFVILLSPQSVTRQWVLVELGGAWTLDKRVIAITYNLARKRSLISSITTKATTSMTSTVTLRS